MRLLESIIDANHRAVAGDASAGLPPANCRGQAGFSITTAYIESMEERKLP
jgi:hypothetical protein